MHKIRVISATIHDDTQEVEVIAEKITDQGTLDEKTRLVSFFVDCEQEVADL